MFNKKIVVSTMSILASLAMLGGTTFALFTDQASSTENKFSTGNADLQITNDETSPPTDPVLPYSNSITGVSFSDIAPGFSEDKDFWLKNNSAGDFGMDVKVDFDNVTTDADLGNALMIGFQCDTDENGLDGGDPVVGPKSVNVWVTDLSVALAAIGAHQDPEVGATTVSDQDELLCRMSASVSEEAGDEISGQSSKFDVFFDATQVVGP